ncbi:MAG: CxxC-x17-CxxC domain-containing protein [Candidatus Omnitrophota bacterium]
MKKHSQGESDIIGLITKLQEQLSSLERKVDTLINRAMPKPAEVKPVPQSFPKPFQQPANHNLQATRQDNRFPGSNRQDNRYRERIMYKTICADCRKECQVPFRPVEGRLVYCQVCFSRRKAGNSFRGNFDNKPKEITPTQTTPTQATTVATRQMSEKNKFATKKKIALKKKPVSKKRKGK